MYKVKVTICNPSHNYELSTAFYNIDVAASRESPKYHDSSMNAFLQILKLNSFASDIFLRPLFKAFFHYDTPIDCIFIRNFRQYMAYYLAQNPDFEEATSEDTQSLLLEIDFCY